MKVLKKMSLPCEHCGKIFPTNTLLYKHKHTKHRKPTLVLVDHKMSPNEYHRKRKADSDAGPGGKKKTPSRDPQLDDELVEVDSFSTPPSSQPDPEKDQDLIEIDEYSAPKPDPQNDDGLVVIDKYVRPDSPDPEDDRGLIVIDKYEDKNPSSNIGYRKKYEDCLKAHKKLVKKYNNDILRLDRQRKDQLKSLREKLEDICEDRIKNLTEKHKKKFLDREDDLEKKYGDIIKDLREELNNSVAKHAKELADYEKDCQDKLRTLKDQIKAMEDADEDDSGALARAIYNCTSMEEIFEIIRLINNHQMDEVVENHLPALQNLLLSLSMGILPICQPQRKQVTDQQRNVVDRVQVASKPTAKKLLRDNQREFVNLFTIIKDSLKLARNSYNRYGI